MRATAGVTLPVCLLAVVVLWGGLVGAQVLNYREVGGVRYATLDDVNPSDSTPGSQTDPMNLPQGWALAPSNAATVSAAGQFAWGTDCLVLADGSMIATNPNVRCTDSSLVSTAQNTYRPAQRRIFIASDAAGIMSVTPSSGPMGGGIDVTITGSALGNGQDITQVVLAGVSATIKTQTPTQVVVIAGISRVPVTDAVVVVSTSQGTKASANAFTYLASGPIQSVIPSSGPIVGGNTVTITGTNLGSGSDITAVTFDGTLGTIISQSATQVVVRVPTGTATGTATVSLTSTSQGQKSLAEAYTFNPPPTVTSVNPQRGSPQGGNLVTIQGDLGHIDITSVQLAGVPALIRSQTATQVIVIAQAGSGTGPVVVTSTSRGTATSTLTYSYVTGGSITAVVPAQGPLDGGMNVTITGTGLGSGTDITQVTFGGQACSIQSQTATEVVVVSPKATTAGVVDVAVTSSSGGSTTAMASFTYLAAGTITSVTPNGGPVTGGTTVTITGTALGSGSDITMVSLASTDATILNQTATSVVVRTTAGQPILGNVVVKSTSRGTATLVSGFTYFQTGVIRTVVPPSVPTSGGATITITGDSLGNGNDITAVTLADVPATIVSQTATSVVVQAGRSGQVSGSVTVTSVSRGQTVIANAISYTPDGSPPFAQPSQGPVTGGTTVTITSLTPLGSGTDITDVRIVDARATIVSQTANQVIVVTGPGTMRMGTVAVGSTSRGVTEVPNAFEYINGGSITALIPNNGPVIGKNTVTITGTNLGSGSDITVVTFGAANATIQTQTSSQVVVVAPAGTAGNVDVSVLSATRGTAKMAGGYFYNSSIVTINYFVYNGKQYAALDNADPADQTLVGCQDSFKTIPDGWTLAPDTPETRTAIFGPRFKFGTTCMVLANGIGINSVTGVQCGTNMLTQIGSTVAASGCPARVLITRAAEPGEVDAFKTTYGITNYVVYQGAAYATIENTLPTQPDFGCSNTALTLPAGWSIAGQNANSTAVAQQYVFGTSCLVLANGYAVGHSGAQCGTAQLLQYLNFYAVQNCQSRILITTPLPVPVPQSQPRSINMKMLVVSNTGDPAQEIQLRVAIRVAQMVGSQYDIYAAAPVPTALAGVKTGDLTTTLASSDTMGNYMGIIVTQNLVLLNNPSVKTQLTDYARKFRLNMVVLYTFPTAAMGVTANTTATAGATPSNLRFASNWRTHNSTSGMMPNHKVPMSAVFHYPSIITDPTIATPVLEFVTANGDVEGVAAIEYNPQDGHKEMHMFFDQADWDLPSALYSHMWLNWMMRGLYVGQRRVHLSTEIDDLFLSTGLWQPAINQPNGPAFRISASDFQALSDFVDATNAQLPAGSTFRCEWPLNGAGVGNGQGVTTGDDLFARAASMVPKFFWLTHGWQHLNLTTNGNPDHPTTYAETYVEVNRNYQFITTNLIKTPQDFVYFSNQSQVTAAITGLFNPNALQAIWDNGIRYIVGDNSLPILTPSHPYHCLHTTKAVNGFDGLVAVPRWPTSIYFDVHTPEENVAEFNFYYLKTYGRNFTMDEILQLEMTRTTHNLLVLRQDPYMFHQANTHVFSYPDPVTGAQGSFSLLTLWIRTVLTDLMSYINLPILTFKLDTMAERCLTREALDACNVNVVANVDANENVASLTFTGGVGCTLPVTGAVFNQTLPGMTQENYGPDVTTFFPLSAAANVQATLVTPVSMRT